MDSSSILRIGSLLAAVAAGGLAPAQIAFDPATHFPAGTSPDSACTGDFDGDGDQDIAVASDDPGAVRIFTNAGGGAFSLTQTVPTGNGSIPFGIVAGNLDGDGDVDLAVTLRDSERVQILVNTGGTFSAGPAFLVGVEPRHMVIGHVNNDLALDLVCSNRASDTVSVLTNLGNLSFGVAHYPAGGSPRELALADVTNDGHRDIVVAAHDDHEVRILINGGAGAFAFLSAHGVGALEPEGLFVGLVDNDTRLDIVVAGSDSLNGYLALIFNLGGVSFTPPTYLATGGLDPSSVIGADLDLDGDRDLAVTNRGSDDLSILTGDDFGGFSAPQMVPVGVGPSHVISSNLDGDGARDLIVTDETSGTISILMNRAQPDPCLVVDYCQSKQTSTGLLPRIGRVGTPSLATQDFVITIADALPNVQGLAFWSSTGRASLPFQDGTLCVDPPAHRLPVQQFSPSGSADYPIPVTPQMVGTKRWFQWWFRDPSAPSTTGLSNALEVSFCD